MRIFATGFTVINGYAVLLWILVVVLRVGTRSTFRIYTIQ